MQPPKYHFHVGAININQQFDVSHYISHVADLKKEHHLKSTIRPQMVTQDQDLDLGICKAVMVVH